MFSLLGCNHFPDVDKSDSCTTPKNETALQIESINRIKEKPDLSIDDARSLLKRLAKKLGIDTPVCKGYEDQIRQAAKQAISQRADALLDDLLELCSQEIPNSADLDKVGAIIEEKRAAKEALEYIGEATDACD